MPLPRASVHSCGPHIRTGRCPWAGLSTVEVPIAELGRPKRTKRRRGRRPAPGPPATGGQSPGPPGQDELQLAGAGPFNTTLMSTTSAAAG
jgi:hypothetical protein